MTKTMECLVPSMTGEQRTAIAASSGNQMIDYGVAETTIADLKSRYEGLTISSPADYELVRLAIADVRSIRTGVEKSRKELKADALEFGRRVDAEAKRVTALLEAIETPLVAEKSRVDSERAAERERKEAEARAKLAAEIAAENARREAEIAAEREKREAEMAEQRRLIAAQQAELEAKRLEFEKAKQAELDRIAAERAAEDAKRAEAKRIEDERLAAERAKLEADRAELMRLENERLAVLDAERAEVERAERERLEALERAEAEAKVKADRKRLAPDREKVGEFAEVLRTLAYPEVKNNEAKELVDASRGLIDTIVFRLSEFAAR